MARVEVYGAEILGAVKFRAHVHGAEPVALTWLALEPRVPKWHGIVCAKLAVFRSVEHSDFDALSWFKIHVACFVVH